VRNATAAGQPGDCPSSRSRVHRPPAPMRRVASASPATSGPRQPYLPGRWRVRRARVPAQKGCGLSRRSRSVKRIKVGQPPLPGRNRSKPPDRLRASRNPTRAPVRNGSRASYPGPSQEMAFAEREAAEHDPRPRRHQGAPPGPHDIAGRLTCDRREPRRPWAIGGAPRWNSPSGHCGVTRDSPSPYPR
jgi:hypothetical protein